MGTARNASSWPGWAPALALAISVTACAGPSATTMVNLEALPTDKQKRDDYLETAAARPGPENRKPLPRMLRRVETAAATTAAILGVLFSTSSNVLLGVGVPLDAVGTDSDPGPSDRRSKRASKKTDDGEEEADDPDPPEPVDATKLVPWVQLPTNTPP